MSLFNWSDEFSVGILEVDEQHRDLFRIIRELDEAAGAGRGDEVLGSTIRLLLSHAQTHFAEEEQAMLASGYRDYDEHKADHDRIWEQLSKYEQRYLKERPKLAAEILPFLVGDWLKSHIPLMDRKAATCFLDRE